MNEYDKKIEARRARLQARAARLRAASEASSERGFGMLRAIPLGQPMLVDHYSYKRDRNYRARACRAIERAAELEKMAQAADLRAMGVGRAGVSSDDPQAVTKLREKLAALEAEQAQMKAANAAWRKLGRPGIDRAGDWAAVANMAGLTAALLEAIINRIKIAPYSPEPFPAYALHNNSANMRRVQQRIEELERRSTESRERRVGDVRVIEDAEDNRLLLIFPGKPAVEIRALLKRNGFKWSPSRGAWVRMLNSAGRSSAEYVLGKVAVAA
jgi:hypothetical protein